MPLHLENGDKDLDSNMHSDDSEPSEETVGNTFQHKTNNVSNQNSVVTHKHQNSSPVKNKTPLKPDEQHQNGDLVQEQLAVDRYGFISGGKEFTNPDE